MFLLLFSGFYNKECYNPPFNQDFHAKMLELERTEKKLDGPKVRKIFQTATDQFGLVEVGKLTDRSINQTNDSIV